MPLTSYTPRVQHEGYDLINQAFNRFVVGQQRGRLPQPATGGGGAGDTAGQLSQGPQQQGQPSFQGGPQQPYQPTGGGNPSAPNPVPDFFNRPQTPAYQPPGGSIAAGGALRQNPAIPGGQQQQPQQQVGLGDLGQLLALLGPVQSGQGFYPTANREKRGFGMQLRQHPFQGVASQYGNPQQPELAALFNPGSYYGVGPGGGRMQGTQLGLNPQVQQQALSYILQQLAMGGMPQQGNVGGLIGGTQGA